MITDRQEPPDFNLRIHALTPAGTKLLPSKLSMQIKWNKLSTWLNMILLRYIDHQLHQSNNASIGIKSDLGSCFMQVE